MTGSFINYSDSPEEKDANVTSTGRRVNTEAGQEDFLAALDFSDDEPNHPYTQDAAPAKSSSQQQYTCKKPIWWKRQSGKGASKGQRRAMNHPDMQRFKLEKPSIYGSKLQWNQVFDIDTTTTMNSHDSKEIWLELGFGLGDNLLCLASQPTQQSRYYVGAEVHTAGIGTIFSRMHSGIQQHRYWDGYTLFGVGDETKARLAPAAAATIPNASTTTEILSDLYNHVRIYMGDGTKLLHSIPDQSVAAVLVTFPDPFPQNHQQHWRLLQLEILSELRRVLTGRLYLATDHQGYHDWSHQQVQTFNCRQRDDDCGTERPAAAVFGLVEPTPDRAFWLPVVSKYEQTGRNEGQTTWLSCWEAR